MTTEQIFRSGDASEESGARAGESGHCAPTEEPACDGCGKHGVALIHVPSPDGVSLSCAACVDLGTEEDHGPWLGLLLGAALIAAVVWIIVTATGCAPAPAPAAHPPTWCEDCAVSGGGR